MLKIIKKDGTRVDYDVNKIKNAVNKASERVSEQLTQAEQHRIIHEVKLMIMKDLNCDYNNISGDVSVRNMHIFVEMALEKVCPNVAKSYREYRNYKTDFVHMLDEVFSKTKTIMYHGDRDNANSDSSLISTQQSLIRGELTKSLYDKFYMNNEERAACKDGYIYIHDKKDRMFTTNCCIMDIKTILTGGFHSCNFDYTEPKNVTSALAVIKNIIMMAASQQYGGLSVRLDDVLPKYCEMSEKAYQQEFLSISSMGIEITEEVMKASEKYAILKTIKDLEQGIQGMECDLNTLASSRGDFAFVTVSIGLDESFWGQEVSKAFLRVRKGGQGKEGFKKPVLFPKLVFLYTEELHGKGMPLEDVFIEAIECSSKAMYPDYVSLDAGSLGEVYSKFKLPVTPMG